jgi:hypothetical protein
MDDEKELKYLASNVLSGIIDTVLNTSFHQYKRNTGETKLLSRYK